MILSKSKESLVEDPFESDLFKRFFREQAILLNRDLSLNQAIFSKEVLSKAIPSKTVLSKAILSLPKRSFRSQRSLTKRLLGNMLRIALAKRYILWFCGWIGLESRLQMRERFHQRKVSSKPAAR